MTVFVICFVWSVTYCEVWGQGDKLQVPGNKILMKILGTKKNDGFEQFWTLGLYDTEYR
jgi:hypothetical protein